MDLRASCLPSSLPLILDARFLLHISLMGWRDAPWLPSPQPLGGIWLTTHSLRPPPLGCVVLRSACCEPQYSGLIPLSWDSTGGSLLTVQTMPAGGQSALTQNFSRLHVTLGPPSTLQGNLDSDSWGIDHRSPSRWASDHSPNTAQDSSCWDPRMSGTSSRKCSRCLGASTDGTQGRLCSQTALDHAEGSQVSSEGSQPRATTPPEENQPPGHWPPYLGAERPGVL